MLLYKYCDPEGVQILEERSIWLTDPRCFNDPFDLSPHFPIDAAVAGAGSVRVLRRQQIDEARTALRINSTVVLSLSTLRNSLAMWGHYAKGHSGLVIGFDATAGILSNSSRYRNTPAPVKYSPHRPSAPSAAALTHEQVLLAKCDEWKYEHEWRLVDSSFSSDDDSDDGYHWPFDIHEIAVREVVLGCKADRRLERRVMTTLSQPIFQHVRLFDAEPDPRHYRLNLVERPRDLWQ